jgi:hypothetical protein
MQMSLTEKIRSYPTVFVIVAAIAVNAPIASATSITDLVFPETVPVPTTKSDHIVSGSVPRIARGSEAPDGKRNPAAQEAPSGRQRVSNAKGPK